MTLPDFRGLRVAAFESRRADDMARLIERHGGRPFVSPSMREVPLDNAAQVAQFAADVQSGKLQIMVFLTGVGFRHLLHAVENRASDDDPSADARRSAYVEALARIVTVARGPKPVAAMREVGLAPTLRAPEPNTWREVLAVLQQHGPLAGKTVGVQEYGLPNPQLERALELQGARVRTIQIYRWDFPEDVRPLEENVRALVAGQRDVALFTSAYQVVNVLKLAAQLQLEEQLRSAIGRMVVASIGPTTSETLRELGLPVDLEPEHSKMGHLVTAAAERAPALLSKKRTSIVVREPADVEMAASARRHPSENGPFMKACRREPAEIVPIWLMRQAGRYLPEYRAIRSKTTFLELCRNPDLCAEVMIRTVQRLGVDAAIIFSDLLPILQPMGLELEFAGEGPVIDNPVREAADVDRVRELESLAELDFVLQTVRATRAGLPPEIPVIGFAGAPFTLASYVIEGGGSRHYAHTKRLMYADQGAWHVLAGKLARAVTRYLNGQIAAGAQAVQLFDSWAGCLNPDDYRRFVLPHMREIFRGIPPGVPVINFATGNPALLPLLAEAGGTVIGIDWRTRLDDAWRTVGPSFAVQGNLDPAVLLADHREIRRQVENIFLQTGRRPGHIFNLGHGVLPQTPPENAAALVDMVHELGSKLS